MILLTRDPIDVPTLQAASGADGAACLFVGLVRDHSGDRAVQRLEYEAYEELALSVLQQIAAEAQRRWGVTDVHIVHRLGSVDVGQPSVAIAVHSPHRAEAFDACRFVIDTVKTRAPIWKKEIYSDGTSLWRETCEGDEARAQSKTTVLRP